MRGGYAPEIFGLKGLTVEEKQAVKVGTTCALRAFEQAWEMEKRGLPWAIESCDLRQGHPHVFKLPQAIDLANKTGAGLLRFYQCRFGSVTAKPSVLLYNGMTFSEALGFQNSCGHEPVWHVQPWDGRTSYIPHAYLMGKALAIRYDDRNAGETGTQLDGPYVSKRAA